jgi:hypothetical protein
MCTDIPAGTKFTIKRSFHSLFERTNVDMYFRYLFETFQNIEKKTVTYESKDVSFYAHFTES